MSRNGDLGDRMKVILLYDPISIQQTRSVEVKNNHT